MLLSWPEVQKVVAEARNSGAMLTNFFQTEGEFEVERIGSSTFLLKQEKGFRHLYFFTKSAEQLAMDWEEVKVGGEGGQWREHSFVQPPTSDLQPIVVDVLGPDRTREPLEKVFKDAGWEVLTVLQRMGRKTPVDQVEGGRLKVEQRNDSSIVQPSTLSLRPEKATAADAVQVQALLEEYFDAEQEQLPDARQIGEWVEKGTLLVTRAARGSAPTGENALSGFVAFDLSPAQLYLRYWFVHPDARGTGVGGALMHAMFAAGANTKRQYFWVKTDNENAIKRYQHYGFQFEPMKNTVLRLRQEALK